MFNGILSRLDKCHEQAFQMIEISSMSFPKSEILSGACSTSLEDKVI